MQSFVYGRVAMCLQHSHHFASCHHVISYIMHHIASTDTRIEYGANLRKMLRQNESVLRHEVSFGKYNFISLVMRRDLSLQSKDIFLYEAWIFFFMKHEKKGRCFFAESSKTVYVNFMHRKETNCNNLHIQFSITYSRYHIVLPW
jgi:hypothetical protein